MEKGPRVIFCILVLHSWISGETESVVAIYFSEKNS